MKDQEQCGCFGPDAPAAPRDVHLPKCPVAQPAMKEALDRRVALGEWRREINREWWKEYRAYMKFCRQNRILHLFVHARYMVVQGKLEFSQW